MRLPLQLHEEHPVRRWAISIIISLGAIGLVLGLGQVYGFRAGIVRFENLFYDTFYSLRPPEDQTNGPVIIVAADDYSMDKLVHVLRWPIGWPWPRTTWAVIADYAQKHGAKAVAIDITFDQPSVYDGNANFGDDDGDFADKLNSIAIPVIIGARYARNENGEMAVPVSPAHRRIGAVDMLSESVLRYFPPGIAGHPSLAAGTLIALGRGADIPRESFRMHYYGPNLRQVNGQTVHTFTYVSAADVVLSRTLSAAAQARLGALFQGKIVLIGGTGQGTYDLKPTPVGGVFPGVEYQATGMVNMLNHQYVQQVSPAVELTILIVATLLAGIAGAVPRQAIAKAGGLAAALAAPQVLSFMLFTRPNIYWLPPGQTVLAGILAGFGALGWSFFAEDRKRRFFVKALGQYVSPGVAEELSRNRGALKIGGERREMTVLFTDIAGFTDLSERLEPEKLGHLLNYYLGEMSEVVLQANGTLDKYVGDAIVTFWNAPLLQPDHAAMACRAAMAMRQREIDIGAQLAELGGPGMHTRLGINTGPMSVGNMGSPQKFNYSVLGDSVNLGSRLEAANKMYGTNILLSQFTAEHLGGRFLLRKIDVLRVKGKLKPVAIFEPLAEGTGEEKLVTLARGYESAFVLYQSQKWDESSRQLLELRGSFPDDGPIKTLLRRVEDYRTSPPPPDWDGVYVAHEK